jgi:hypothetical protein
MTNVGSARPSRASSIAFFVALLASAVLLGPALAHAFELPNKINLPRDQYFVVQQIYRGWSGFGLVLVVQIAALLAAAYLSRRESAVVVPTLLAILCVAAAQALFWLYTQPANAATMNWTTEPDDWEKLRRNWEYSHLAGAGLQLVGIACLTVAIMARRPIRR